MSDVEYTGTVYAVATCADIYTERAEGLARVERQLEATHYTVFRDREGLGRFLPFYKALLQGIALADEQGYSHVTLLPDDCLFSPYFGSSCIRATRNRPGELLDLMVNHAGAGGLPKEISWYTTPEGFVGMGGTASVQLWRKILDFYHRAVSPDNPPAFDEMVNMYCMYGEPGRKVWHTSRSLLWHDSTVPSRCGNDYQKDMPGRHGEAREVGLFDPNGDVVDLGRTYEQNHWRLFHYLNHEYAKRERSAARMYELHKATTLTLAKEPA